MRPRKTSWRKWYLSKVGKHGQGKRIFPLRGHLEPRQANEHELWAGQEEEEPIGFRSSGGDREWVLQRLLYHSQKFPPLLQNQPLAWNAPQAIGH